MFKKIEIWILYLAILLGFLFAIGFGTLVRQELVGTRGTGWLSKTALTLAEIPSNLAHLKRVIEGSDFSIEDRFPNLDGFNGTPNIDESYLLLSIYDGDLGEGIVELVDLTNFEVLHKWNPDIDSFNKLVEPIDEFKNLSTNDSNRRKILMHPKLTEDGGLIFGWESPLRKIDACSNLVFQNSHDLFHHSIETDINKKIWTSSHLYPQNLPIEKVGRGIPSYPPNDDVFLDDAIVQLSPDGEMLYEKSVSEIFIDNGLEYLLFTLGDEKVFTQDPIHINDVQPVNFDGEYWKKGDLFLSLRHQSMVLLYRPSTNEIIWKLVGPLFHQHDVDILDSHRISIFNNNSKDFVGGDKIDGHNEVLIYDFKTDKYFSYLKGSLVKHDVRTITQGISEILPNGDLFVEESNYGRILYFNDDGSLRWTHVNRSKKGMLHYVGWSRILYTKEDIKTVNNFLNNLGACNE